MIANLSSDEMAVQGEFGAKKRKGKTDLLMDRLGSYRGVSPSQLFCMFL